MEHKEARHNAAEMTEHEILKTIERILDDAKGELSMEDLEMLDYCWHILKDIACTKQVSQ